MCSPRRPRVVLEGLPERAMPGVGEVVLVLERRSPAIKSQRADSAAVEAYFGLGLSRHLGHRADDVRHRAAVAGAPFGHAVNVSIHRSDDRDRAMLQEFRELTR